MGKEVEKVFGNDEETVDHTTEEQKEDTPKDNSKEDSSKKDVPEHEDVPSGDEKDQSKKTYTQEEVDAMMARARKKYTKGSKEEVLDEPEHIDEHQENTKPEEQRDLSTGITVDKLARAELKAQMAIGGVNPAKLVYACKMIDVADVLDEAGQYSEEKAKTAIEEMLKVMPELKAQQQEQNQFYFGAPEQEENSQQEQKSVIDKIFGN